MYKRGKTGQRTLKRMRLSRSSARAEIFGLHTAYTQGASRNLCPTGVKIRFDSGFHHEILRLPMAAMASTVMLFSLVSMVMVVAVYIGIIAQSSIEQGRYRIICLAGNASI